jgi:hypothetical protein
MRNMRCTPEVVVTLLVRVSGLILAVLYLPQAISGLLSLLFLFIPQMGNFDLRSSLSNVFGAVWPVGLVAAGCYCFLSGRWLVRRLLTGLEGSDVCKSCGYDLRGIARGRRCPECGAMRG